jgi:hypothetical protein
MEANWSDPQAIGVTFDFDPVRLSARVRYLSANKDALKLFRKAVECDDCSKAVLRQASNGVIEMQVRLETSRDLSTSFLLVRAMLGHAVFP